jgi:hypothetical protein
LGLPRDWQRYRAGDREHCFHTAIPAFRPYRRGYGGPLQPQAHDLGLAKIVITNRGANYDLCPYFPGYNFCWERLDKRLVEKMVQMLGFMDMDIEKVNFYGPSVRGLNLKLIKSQ